MKTKRKACIGTKIKQAAIIISFFLLSCGTADESWVAQWCYVREGLYLVYGEPDCDEIFETEKYHWPREGFVSDVFYSYNEDSERHIYWTKHFKRSEVAYYLASGYRIVGIYQNGGTGQNDCVRIKSMSFFDSKPFFEIVISWK